MVRRKQSRKQVERVCEKDSRGTLERLMEPNNPNNELLYSGKAPWKVTPTTGHILEYLPPPEDPLDAALDEAHWKASVAPQEDHLLPSHAEVVRDLVLGYTFAVNGPSDAAGSPTGVLEPSGRLMQSTLVEPCASAEAATAMQSVVQTRAHSGVERVYHRFQREWRSSVHAKRTADERPVATPPAHKVPPSGRRAVARANPLMSRKGVLSPPVGGKSTSKRSSTKEATSGLLPTRTPSSKDSLLIRSESFKAVDRSSVEERKLDKRTGLEIVDAMLASLSKLKLARSSEADRIQHMQGTIDVVISNPNSEENLSMRKKAARLHCHVVRSILNEEKKAVNKSLAEFTSVSATEFPSAYHQVGRTNANLTNGMGFVSFDRWRDQVLESPHQLPFITIRSPPLAVSDHLTNVKGSTREDIKSNLLKRRLLSLESSTQSPLHEIINRKVWNDLPLGRTDMAINSQSRSPDETTSTIGLAADQFPKYLIPHLLCGSYHACLTEVALCSGKVSHEPQVDELDTEILVHQTTKLGFFSILNTVNSLMLENVAFEMSKAKTWEPQPQSLRPATPLPQPPRQAVRTPDRRQRSLQALPPLCALSGPEDLTRRLCSLDVVSQLGVLEMVFSLPLMNCSWRPFSDHLLGFLGTDHSLPPEGKGALTAPLADATFGDQLHNFVLRPRAVVFDSLLVENCDLGVSASEKSDNRLTSVGDVIKELRREFVVAYRTQCDQFIEAVNSLRYHGHTLVQGDKNWINSRKKHLPAFLEDPLVGQLTSKMKSLAATLEGSHKAFYALITSLVKKRLLIQSGIHQRLSKLRVTSGRIRLKGGYLSQGMILKSIVKSPTRNEYVALRCIGRGGFAEVWEVLALTGKLERYAAKITFLEGKASTAERETVLATTCNEVYLQNLMRSFGETFVTMCECFEIDHHIFCSIMLLALPHDLQQVLATGSLRSTQPDSEKLQVYISSSQGADPARASLPAVISEVISAASTLPQLLAIPRELDRPSCQTVKAWCRHLILAAQRLEKIHIVHRDIKPANVLLLPCEDGYQLKIADFGLGKSLPLGSTAAEIDYGLPLERMLGTIKCESPEATLARLQRSKFRLTSSEDVWQVGLVLYQIAFGEVYQPFGCHWGSVQPGTFNSTLPHAGGGRESADFAAVTTVADAFDHGYWSPTFNHRDGHLPWNRYPLRVRGFNVLEKTYLRDLLGCLLAPQKMRSSAREALDHPFFG
eukprot:GHVH01001524.1.p1 GENE.GHVH01001524.1~~GHVH01001524.1.p1  ORF type:complete len:1221 (+),score=195.62 GHVH01001524.1:122-3784(+)